MDKLLERGAVDFDMIGRVAARLTAMHARPSAAIASRARWPRRCAKNWRENFDRSQPFIGRTLSRARYERIEGYRD